MPRPTREQRLHGLKSSIDKLRKQNSDVEAQLAKLKSELQGDPATTIREHIRLLHEYNEIKDVAQTLIGMVAEDRGVCQIEVYKDFGVDPKDD